MEEERVIYDGRPFIVELLNDKMRSNAKELREIEKIIEYVWSLYPKVSQLSNNLYEEYVRETNRKPKNAIGI